MWKFVKFGLGLLLIFASFAGVSALFDGTIEESGRRIVENGKDTTGTIESRIEHTVAGRFGKLRGAGKYYSIKYRFTADDGKTYGGEVNVSKEQAYAYQDGQKIPVRYMSGQPSINSPLDFEDYMTMEDAENAPIGTILFSAVLFLLGGAYMCWSSWQAIKPAPSARSVSRAAGVAARQPPRRAVRTGGTPAFGRR